MSKSIIGIYGRASVGKDTVADYLVKNHGYIKLSFAAPLKDAVAGLFGWPRESLDDPLFKQTLDTFWNVSPRTALQLLGTEGIRNNFGEDFWIRNLMRRIGDAERVVIADMRFENEYHAIRALTQGQVWKVEGPIRIPMSASQQSHASEGALEGFSFDLVIHNEHGLEELYEQIKV